MVKNLLSFAAAAALCTATFAQQEAGIIDATKSIGSLTAGAAVATSTNVTMSALYDDTYKAVSLQTSGEASSVTEHVKSVIIGGITYAVGNGIQGSTNPSNAKLGNVPHAGAMFSISVKADGHLYVIDKVSSSKPIYVVNQTDNNTVAYSINAFTASGATTYSFTLPNNGAAGYFASIDEYNFGNLTEEQQSFVGGNKSNEILSPAACYTAAEGTGTWSGDATGVVAFPVKANKTYLFYAAGSKVSCGGFVFDKGASTMTTVEPGADTPTPNPSALKQVKYTPDYNAPIYNILGQRVYKGYKGICVQNGHKFVVK